MTKFTGSWTKKQGGFTAKRKSKPGGAKPWTPAGRKKITMKGTPLDKYVERSLELLKEK